MLLGAGFCEARRKPRLVTPRRVAVDDPLAGHLVDDRDRLVERRLRAAEILGVERYADGLERRAQPRAHLPIVFPVFDVLAVRLQGGLGTLGHGRNVLSLLKKLRPTKGLL